MGLLLLGYGLVEIPRQLWKSANPETMLKWSCHRSAGRRRGGRAEALGPWEADWPATAACDLGFGGPTCGASLRDSAPTAPVLLCRRVGKYAQAVMRSRAELEDVITVIYANARQMRRHDPLRKYMDIVSDYAGACMHAGHGAAYIACELYPSSESSRPHL